MDSLIRFDRRATLWFQSWPTFLHPYMFAVTQLGSVAWVICLASIIAITAYFKHRMRFAIAFAAVIPGEIANALIKLIFNRVRPNTNFAHSMILHTKSFPSGHAFGSMMLYGLLAYLAFTRLPHGWNWIAGLGLSLLIILIGTSRVYLGAHYFIDVIGGWIFGAVVLTLVIKLTKL